MLAADELIEVVGRLSSKSKGVDLYGSMLSNDPPVRFPTESAEDGSLNQYMPIIVDKYLALRIIGRPDC